MMGRSRQIAGTAKLGALPHVARREHNLPSVIGPSAMFVHGLFPIPACHIKYLRRPHTTGHCICFRFRHRQLFTRGPQIPLLDYCGTQRWRGKRRSGSRQERTRRMCQCAAADFLCNLAVGCLSRQSQNTHLHFNPEVGSRSGHRSRPWWRRGVMTTRRRRDSPPEGGPHASVGVADVRQGHDQSSR